MAIFAIIKRKPKKNPIFGNLYAIIAKKGTNKLSYKSIYKGNA